MKLTGVNNGTERKILEIFDGCGEKVGFDDMFAVLDSAVKKAEGRYEIGSDPFLVLVEDELRAFFLRKEMNGMRRTLT